MKLQNRTVHVLVGPGFEDLEFWVPVMRLREEGADVVITAPEAGRIYEGKHGLTARSRVAAADVKKNDVEAVVVPGGWAPDKLRRDDDVKTLVRTTYTHGKPVAMICHAGLVGISAGIVNGHRATGSEGIKDDLINAGATWIDEPAFQDENLVWGRVVDDIPAFCRVLVRAVAEAKSPVAA